MANSKGDVTGFGRECWNRDNFPFAWKTWQVEAKKDVGTYPVSHFQGLTTRYSTILSETLNNTRTPKDEPLHFICGSEQELEHLSRLISWSEPQFVSFAADIKVKINSETGFQRAQFYSLGSEEHIWCRIVQEEDEWDSYGDIDGWSDLHLPIPLRRLFAMVIEENTSAGLNWECRGQRSSRASVTPKPITLDFSFSPPSQHEHLEARLQLRDWLQTRVPSQEVERLLGD